MNSKDPDFTDDAGFLEIEDLVKEAKKLEEKNEFKNAKNKYLDAASKALEISKRTAGIEKLTYENICRSLIDHAKEVKILEDMAHSPLPHVPVKDSTTKTMKKSSVPKSQMMLTQKPQVLQFIIIKETGTPIYSKTNSDLTEETKTRLNEILFSGALTAITQLMQEVIQKPIQNIQFEGGNIVIKFKSSLIFVAYVNADVEEIENPLTILVENFMQNIYPQYEEKITKGAVFGANPDVENLINQYFKV